MPPRSLRPVERASLMLILVTRLRDSPGRLRLLQLLFISASVRSSDSTENSPSPVASDRASIRSTLLFTTPVSVTRPFSTMMWIGGLAIAA